jgi:DNA-binding transcriptional LysR family regulator
VTRLRHLLGDPLFERMHGGVRPTPRAERLAQAVRTALATLEVAWQRRTVLIPCRRISAFAFTSATSARRASCHR